MDFIDKIVDFKKYCKTCKHYDQKEWEDPCNGCLDTPVNQHSHKPVNYEEDAERVKKEEEEAKEQK